MKLNYLIKLALVFNIIPQHPHALVSFWKFYNCHKQWHHTTEMLISLHVIQTHSAVVLTYLLWQEGW